MPNRRRVIFVDLDGTLMDHEIVDPSAPDALAAARANGHLVFVCTGRSINGLDPAMSHLEFDGWVTSGGAVARIGEIIVHETAMAAHELKRLTNYFEQNDIEYLLLSDDGVFGAQAAKDHYMESWYARIAAHSDELMRLGLERPMEERLPFGEIRPLEAANNQRISGAAFVAKEPEAFGLAVDELGGEFHIIPGSVAIQGGSGGEVGVLGVTKATGISAVLAALGMSADDAIGIGDSRNDAEMFELCGVAVAMGNASDELKALADFVTSPVLQGGIRDALIKLELI